MRQTETASPLASAFSVRIIILAALVAALIIVAGQARPASAVNEGGIFSFAATQLNVAEGETAQLPVVWTGRTDVSSAGNINLGINIQLISAETADIGDSGQDFCMPIQGAVLPPLPVPITTFADADLENETFSVTLTVSSGVVGCAGGNAIIGGPDTLTVTIQDTVGSEGDFEFVTTSSTAGEGDIVTLDVLRNGDLNGSASVECNVTAGTAEASDWDPIDAFANFNDNDSTGICRFQILADADVDVSETVVVTLQNPFNGTVGSPSQHTITIVEDDGDFEFTTTSSQADEGAIVSLTVVRSGDLTGAASVECNVTGGTGEDSDWDPIDAVANFGDGDNDSSCQFQVLNDADIDVTETLIITLQDPINGTIGSPAQHTLTIGADGDFEFALTSSIVAEGGIATLAVLRSGSLSGSASVDCNITGGTGEGSDWDPIDAVATFGSGDDDATCQFQILADADVDIGETLIVTLQNPFNGSVGSPSVHTITIGGDQLYTFQSATYTVSEGAGIVTVTVVRSTSVGTGAVSWDITGGTATAGVDYVDATGTVNFVAGQTTQTFNITIIATAAAEPNETIIVSLINPVNGSLGVPDDTTITITETGIPTVTDVNPDNIPTAGGTSVVITGTNFLGATAVTFGAANATSFVINNSTQITAVAPPRNAGTYDIRVTTPSGTSADTVLDDITYGAADTVTYQLSVRWSLIAWLGKDNVSISAALQGTVALVDSQAQTAPNNILPVVTAVATWDNPTQRYLFWFPAGGSVPGANDITQFEYGTPYWIAVTSSVNWTVIEGP